MFRVKLQETSVVYRNKHGARLENNKNKQINITTTKIEKRMIGKIFYRVLQSTINLETAWKYEEQ